ncbi:MAG: excinuclease ABC subunit UvrC [Actinomycetota bacterium]|nr:excinuclease ABC subunit UvrC [Actinomycetota bacterium]
MTVTKKAIAEQLKMVPDRPGAYIFKDERGNVLYVGKARSLKKRIRSYFRAPTTVGLSPKIRAMVERIADFDFYVTDSEVEALILECNLIKKHCPDFNVDLRDDKSYPSLAIVLEEEFPRVLVTRKLNIKGARYFGPYTKAHAVRETLDTLRRVFPLRTCSDSKMARARASGSPCLDYHIKRCLGPCVGKVSPQEYREMIEQVCLFLEGKQEKIVEKLEEEMREAVEKLEFEKAARLRNRIQAARHVLERQKMMLPSLEDLDVIALVLGEEMACVEVFFVRGGKMLGSESFILERKGADEDELLSSFVKQFYLRVTLIPHLILSEREIGDRKLIESWLSQRRGKRVEIRVPRRGEKRRLVELARENARHTFELLKVKRRVERERASKALAELKEEIGLPSLPYRIECFDVSTIRGAESVGSMIVFENGKPKSEDYRRFRIKWVRGQDDFAMMGEVLKRRFARFLEERGQPGSKFGLQPDLVIVDGGKPQLSAAIGALSELKIESIPLAALAKGEEKIYLPDISEPLTLPAFSHALNLVRRIRDEAHRFAIAYHRGLREKKMVKSVLDDIPGVGERRKKLLMDYFGAVDNLTRASLEELEAVPGLPSTLAQRIFEYFRGERKRVVL